MVHWDLKVPVNMKKWWHKAANKRRLFFRGRLPSAPKFPQSAALRLEWKVNMYGAQIKEGMERQARTVMRLRRKNSDASKSKPGWQASSDFVAPLLGGTSSLACRLVQVASVSQLQGFALRTSTCALTSGSSGSTNTPLRSAFAAH
jgi:hypothetical protein